MASRKNKQRANAAPPAARPARPPVNWKWVLFAGLLLTATLSAYRPAWNGGPVWDDDAHLTRADLQSGDGLRRIWFEVGATQQYYPIVHSAFWVMHRLWGDRTLGYHIVNITLHATSALLIALLLARFGAPGAMLAALVFALHPVNVESVAWMSELKNALSTVFYLAAALAYLRFDRDRRPIAYGVALVLFLAALLSKTMTATLPAALLVVFWWKRGRLRWREDVLPLAPFLLLGVTAGLATAWIERSFIGAQGTEFTLGVLERVLVAGRVIWFYVSKTLWPANLIFTYPRWQVSATSALQWLAPVAVVAMFAVLWRLRARTRAPFAAFAAFVIALVPVLGFLNVYPFKFSFVADHFQYLAMIPLIALLASGATLLARRMIPSESTAQVALGVPFGVVLGLLTFFQCRQYADAETLYRATLAKNPGSWMAHDNLAALEIARPSPNLDDAERHLRASLGLYPANTNSHNNLGIVYQKRGQPRDARAEHELAIQLDPTNADALNNLGVDEQKLGQLESAMNRYRAALQLRPSYMQAHANLGGALLEAGRPDEAIQELQIALQLAPAYADAHDTMARALTRKGRTADALAEYNEAIRLRPDSAEFRNNFGTLLEQVGRPADAVEQYREALKINPDAVLVHDNLGYVLVKTGRTEEAVQHFQRALALDPKYAPAHYNLGNVWLDANRPRDAIVEYRLALQYEGSETSAECHNNLGVALAEIGRIDEARAEFREALRIRPDFPDAKRNLAKAGG